MADIGRLKQKAFRSAAAGRLQEARAQLEKLLKRYKTDYEIWFLHGAVTGQLGMFSDAESSLRSSLALYPENVEAYANLGLACIRRSNFAGAIEAYKEVLKRAPSYPGACFHLGYAEIQAGDFCAAVVSLEQAIRLQPENLEAYVYLSKVFRDTGSPHEAMKVINNGLTWDPENNDLLLLSASLKLELGEVTEAIEQLDQVLEMVPDCIEAQVCKALAYENKGDFQQALEIIQPLVQSGMKNAGLAIAYARISRHFDSREDAVAYIDSVLSAGNELDRESVGTLNYQLGKMKDALGLYDEAFAHFKTSNTMRTHIFDPVSYSRDMAATRQVYTRKYFQEMPVLSESGTVPVFIVGMPRSGTTLAEQILASHPLVFGAGELPHIDNISRKLAMAVHGGLGYPECMSMATTDVLEKERSFYLDKLSELSTGARWVTDKMPHNFEHLGLIATLFPDARIVHCIRSPLDTCLSIYFNDFNAGHGYATDLAMLGEHYKEYRKTMAHWKEVLPVAIFEMVYENVVEDQEKRSRALIDFCGLEWDPQCMEFYRHKRTISTFSYDQVRKPIYTGSVGRWRRYEEHLGPLIDALAD